MLTAALVLAGLAWLSHIGGAAAAGLSQPQSVIVVSATPPAGARLGSAPRTVSLRFNEAVTDVTAHVLGPNGDRVDLDGTTVTGDGGATVSVTMQSGGTGGYLLTWQGTPSGSTGPADGGALAFAVGRVPSWTGGGATQFLAAGGASPALAGAVEVSEGIALSALVLLVGLVIARTLGWLEPSRRTYRAVSIMLVLVGAGTAVGLALHGPFAAGLPAGEALSRTMFRATLHDAWGIGALVALGGVVIVGAVTAPLLLVPRAQVNDLLGPPPPPPGPLTSGAERTALGGAVLLGAAAVIVGHAISGPLPALWTILVTLHVVAVVVLAALLLARWRPSRSHGRPRPQAATDLRALRGAAIAVAVTGLLLAVHETGVLSAVTATSYGKVTLAKAVVTAALLVAVFAVRDRPAAKRRPVARRRGSAGGRRRISRELQPLPVAAVLLVVATLLTAVLSFQTPGRIAAPRPATGTLLANGMYLEYQLTPARVGQNNIHLYILTAAGSPLSVPAATAGLAWATASGEPLPITLSDAGPGHFLDYGFEIPLAGPWTLRVGIRLPGSATERSFSALVHVHS